MLGERLFRSYAYPADAGLAFDEPGDILADLMPGSDVIEHEGKLLSVMTPM